MPALVLLRLSHVDQIVGFGAPFPKEGADLLGGPDSLMVGRMLWTEFFSNKDWPLASALALVLLSLLVVPFVALQRWQTRLGGES